MKIACDIKACVVAFNFSTEVYRVYSSACLWCNYMQASLFTADVGVRPPALVARWHLLKSLTCGQRAVIH